MHAVPTQIEVVSVVEPGRQSSAPGRPDVKRASVPAGDLAGHTVLVTGATGPGIGSGVCDALHAAGARLVVNGLDERDVRTTVDRYPGSVGVVGDVSQPDQVERMIDEAVRSVGPLTGLVNNAGIGLIEPMLTVTETQLSRILDVNYRGVWLMSQAFARIVAGRGGTGAIVNISSVHATKTIAHYGVYASVKAAVEGLTRACAVEFGSIAVRCNAIAPGYVRMNPDLVPPGVPPHDPSWIDVHTRGEQPLQRLVEPIDCGWAARFLLSEQSRCVTGQVIAVDAGLTTRLYNEDMSARIHASRTRRSAGATEGVVGS